MISGEECLVQPFIGGVMLMKNKKLALHYVQIGKA